MHFYNIKQGYNNTCRSQLSLLYQNRNCIQAIGLLTVCGFLLLLTDLFEYATVSTIAEPFESQYIPERQLQDLQQNEPQMQSYKFIKQCLNESYLTFDLAALNLAKFKETKIIITGILTCNGYHLTKHLLSNNISLSSNIIGFDSLEHSQQFNSQIMREQELIRLGINIIRGNLCDYALLQEIINGIHINIIITASDHNDCERWLNEYKHDTMDINPEMPVININKIVSILPHLPSDIPKKYPVTKKYLIITTFYVAEKDPLHSTEVHYKYSSPWCIDYMKKWYDSFKNVTQMKNDSFMSKNSPYDVVIIHDGLHTEVMNTFSDVIFINMAQYPVHKLRKSANDIRYYHMVKYLRASRSMEYKLTLTTDLRDVEFGRMDPFKYLENKGILEHNKQIYVGAEGRMQDKDAYKRWGWWVQTRLEGCFGRKANITKTFQNKWNPNHNESVSVITTNPGIIATNRHLMIELMETMIDYFSMTKDLNANCNFGVFFLAVMRLCQEKQQCDIINDRIFHSPFRKFLLKWEYLHPHRPRKYIIYHK